MAATPKLNFIDVPKKKDDKTSVWFYFLREEKGSHAKCKECQSILKTSGTTSCLHVHSRTKHKIILKTEQNTEEGEGNATKRNKKIHAYFAPKEEKCLAKTITRMVALDGIPFSVFCTSKDLREALNSMGFPEDLPKCRTSIRRMVMNYGTMIRNEQIQKITEAKANGTKFSVVFDEWTSTRNRRYMNLIITAGGEEFWDVGLIRIQGSLTAERSLELVTTKLKEYNLSLKNDIVCIMTDGTSVMTKIGNVLYQKKSALNSDLESDSDSDDDNEFDDDEEEFLVLTSNGQESVLTHERIGPLVDKVRKIVKLFRRSPLKNETLQKHVLADMGKEIQLILDSKTRWNSMLAMLERFVLIKNSVLKALIDINSTLNFEDWELTRLVDIANALECLKLAVEALCRRDANLLTADAVLDFALTSLKNQGSAISLELAESLEKRISERRTEFSGLLQYIHSGKNAMDSENMDVFSAIAKTRIASLLKDLVTRLHPECETVTQENDTGDNLIHHNQGRNSKTDLEVELRQALEKIESRAHVEKSQPSKTVLATIKKEMAMFEAGGSRGHHLQLIYENLKSVAPTSVESERAFSSAGYFCNKLRSRLNDDTLSELLLLRSYFRADK